MNFFFFNPKKRDEAMTPEQLMSVLMGIWNAGKECEDERRLEEIAELEQMYGEGPK